MNKFNNDNYKRQKEYTSVIFKLRKHGIIPIMQENKLCVYKISVTEKTMELARNYDEYLHDEYIELIPKNNENLKKLNMVNRDVLFKNVISYHDTKVKELIDYFKLTDDNNKENFIKENADNYKYHINIGKIRAVGYDKESFENTVIRKTFDYITCVFKRPSKLSTILSSNNYYNFDMLMGFLCEFLYSNMEQLGEMSFSDKEKMLTMEEKIQLINDIFSSLNVQCLYCKDINEIKNFPFETLYQTNYLTIKDIMLCGAMYNKNILEKMNLKSIIKPSKNLKKIKNN